MAGVLERIRWSPKRISKNSSPSLRVDRRILELQVAKEILAEVFDVGVKDVEEMILNRYEEACYRIIGVRSGRRSSGWKSPFRSGRLKLVLSVTIRFAPVPF